MRTIAVIVVFCISTVATAFQPRIGLWGNTSESGRGWMMDIQNGILVLTSYTYLASGPDQWYLSSGPLTNNGQNFTATLDKYQGGQCLSCTYRAPTLQGNDGTITITFVTETMATISFPGGMTTVIQSYDFGYGPLPGGLLGEWVFVYDTGSATVAERFDFTTTGPAGANGTGTAIDVTRGASCELQVSGSLSGMVLCGVTNASGSIDHIYTFRYGLDQTYSGIWSTHNNGVQTAKMKGFRVGSVTPSTVSDQRLKREVHYVATLANGVRIYSFKYLWADDAYVGVMAQDLLQSPVHRNAVILGADGYYRVNYRALGLRMISLSEWNQSSKNIFADAETDLALGDVAASPLP
jgi:hypothetical protein